MNRRRYQELRARRVALLADSHGAIADSVLEAVATADLIVHAGDVGNLEVMRQLRRVAPLRAVRGNNDTVRQWPAGSSAQLARLPDAIEIALAGGLLVVLHGHQFPRVATRHAKMRAAFPTARCVVYGHSHRRVLDSVVQPWIVNPGACGKSRTYGGASWLGLCVARDEWRITECGFA